MSRNIDIIAVGLILLGFAVFTQTRNAFRFEVTSHRLGFFHQPYGPIVVIPDPPPAPHVPPIPFTRD
ncbi:MAG TPA: hypothetical protein VLI55_11725 [Bryobacteraceae bacterium]|jgi:hypothetical protein|nr:hypothetical protein [Bryobacteraceae bacterium]